MKARKNYQTDKRLLFLFALSNIWSLCVFAQEKTMNYSIISKGDTVGKMQISQLEKENDVDYSVATSVTSRLLMAIKVNVKEEAHYHNKKLASSSSVRFINYKQKANKQTIALNVFYLITDNGKEDTLTEKSIVYDFSMLYFKEPVGIEKVYSNYYQKMIDIQPLDNHSYEIDLPEGGINTYYYESGMCNRVDIKSSLFNAQMLLNH